MDDRSNRNLVGVDEGLVSIVKRAHEIIAELDNGLSFIVTEGMRTQARQEELFKAKATRTMNSYHLRGMAVDLAATVGGEVRWFMPLYRTLSEAMKKSAKEHNLKITWGGDWVTFKDGPHFQLEE
jgi:peptidoglycan L-alanyl-D-glutamate endopeptidase CwlK